MSLFSVFIRENKRRLNNEDVERGILPLAALGDVGQTDFLSQIAPIVDTFGKEKIATAANGTVHLLQSVTDREHPQDLFKMQKTDEDYADPKAKHVYKRNVYHDGRLIVGKSSLVEGSEFSSNPHGLRAGIQQSACDRRTNPAKKFIDYSASGLIDSRKDTLNAQGKIAEGGSYIRDFNESAFTKPAQHRCNLIRVNHKILRELFHLIFSVIIVTIVVLYIAPALGLVAFLTTLMPRSMLTSGASILLMSWYFGSKVLMIYKLLKERRMLKLAIEKCDKNSGMQDSMGTNSVLRAQERSVELQDRLEAIRSQRATIKGQSENEENHRFNVDIMNGSPHNSFVQSEIDGELPDL
eukprot:GHVH01006339.1.p1 GENE.GHVH01006339.1~~GHVH01006339.1.p1  ORF type:complete len:353 (+),score=32.75 GHVH01006339.1:23-1081(+)